MFLLLLACSGLYFALGDPIEAMFMLVAVLFVIAMTAWQEWRTGRAMQALRDLAAPHARVIRNGTAMKILASEVQVGDMLLLESGDRIAADAILVAGSVATDESLLTGESVPIDKKPAVQDPVLSGLANNPPQDTISKVFASTFVVRGNGRALVLSTGKDTAIGKVAGTLMSLKEQPSLMQRSLRRLVRVIGSLAIFFAIVEVLLNVYVDQRSWLESSLSGLTLAMAMLPEEIPVIWTVFLALGAWRISRHQVLTRRPSAVESLGAITYLAVDKTGTLTENKMALVHVGNQSNRFAIVAGDAEKTAMPLELETILFHAVRASSASPVDPMEKALLLHMPASMPSESSENTLTPTHECAFSAEFPAMAMAYADENPETLTWSCKGAPEAVFELCRLSEIQRAVWNAEIQRMAQLGWRVLAVASACGKNTGDLSMRLNTQTGSWPSKVTDLNFKLIGLIAFADPPRREVANSLKQCHEAGIKTVMLTGDHPMTAMAIANQVGLSKTNRALLGKELDEMDDTALSSVILDIDIFARLQPHHKLRLIQLLKKKGQVIAMTGDGVNDAPALKAADVGIAMGKRGCDLARETASLVLLDDQFQKIVTAIAQGRQIFDNIGKAARFIVAVHIPILLMVLVPSVFGFPAMVFPAHIVVFEMLIDPACSVVFESEPPARDLMTRPPRKKEISPFEFGNLGFGLVQGFGVFFCSLLGSAFLYWQTQDWLDIENLVFLSLCSNVLLLTYYSRANTDAWNVNPLWLYLTGAMVVALSAIYATPLFRSLAGLQPLSLLVFAVFALTLMAAAIWLNFVRRITKAQLFPERFR